MLSLPTRPSSATIAPMRCARLTFQEAPESIKEDPLFRMLVSDGSLEAAVTPERQKQLDADPLEGIDAEGKRAEPDAAERRAPASGRRRSAPKEAPEA